MAKLSDEIILSALQDKENFDTLDKSASSSSFDALLEKSPLKSDNRNNLTLDAGSSSDNEAVKSVRRRIKQISDSDTEAEAEKENVNKQTPDKTKPNVSSDSDHEPRKSRLVFDDSSDDNTPSKDMSAKKSLKKCKQNKKTMLSDSEDEIFSRKSKVVADDSSEDDLSRKNENAEINGSNRKQDKTNVSSDSEDDIPHKSKLLTNDSSDDNAPSKHKNATIRAKRKQEKTNLSSGSEDDSSHKSRLDANNSSENNTSPKNESARISDKRSKLHDRFKGLLSSRSKVPESQKSPRKPSEDEHNSNSDDSSTGIESIKKKIKEKSALLKSGICDPDTSSDEESSEVKKKPRKKKANQKSAIMISPKEMSKPARMSAKQAMENMQKIKSESNRMLREKEVSLPYHRPKALSLKDIMNRRKPALSADGKALPVKMNSEQLKQYVVLLEQRNKEMMELCKSESEEEGEINETPTDAHKESDPQASVKDYDSKEVTYDNVAQNDEKQQEDTVQSVNQMEEANENELPELSIEIVQKEPNLSNTEIPEKDEDADMKDVSDQTIAEPETNTKLATEIESQLMELRYDTEKMRNTEDVDNAQNVGNLLPNETVHIINDDNKKSTSVVLSATESDSDKATQENAKDNSHADDFGDDFSDVDINMEDLHSIIENAKGDLNEVDSPMLIRDPYNLNKKPKLTGAPGMVIDLDGSNPVGPRKLTGVELLKERFKYFSKLKTPEEQERERELKIKPGMLHLKLKQELEEKISEQRSLEWAKRLEEEKQQQAEMNAIRGDDSEGDDLEKIEAKLQEKEVIKESSSETEEDEEEEEDCVMKDKPRIKNPMIDDEAEVSDDEESANHENEQADEGEGNVKEPADTDDDEEGSGESSEESSEDEQENESKPKKGRILKAFEDSDDESTNISDNPADVTNNEANDMDQDTPTDSQIAKDSQDDILPLAQTNQSLSEDLFASQASGNPSDDAKKISDEDCANMTTQTFSILNSNTPDQRKTENILRVPANIDVICESQAVDDANLDDVVGMCSGKFTQTQNLIPAESQLTESQCPIGEDVLELCTGKFYDNPFVSQIDAPENVEQLKEKSTVSETLLNKKPEEDKDLLDSILREMDEPVEQSNKNKYVFDNAENEVVCFETVNNVRKKFTIDSDDESNVDVMKPAKQKLKKRKPEKRALQISDDEEEEPLQSDEEADEYMSEVDEDDALERVVEYDSEENEVEVRPQKQKPNRKMAEFFEQEAELTSEDEWVGSGDEDERGLDRMEREEGDDDTFHQGRLQRELGQIHMRDVLDQDKREVRLIQELLFEDGDLGDGHRQRKFRWRNLLEGEEEPGAVPDLFAESQEEDFESEEQWRKQRHEREVFLRNLKEKEVEEHNISIDRSTIIKANLCSKTMSSLLLEANGTSASARIEETTVVVEKKREEPGRNLPLPVFQQSYHGSLLTRGRGALARLAALAVPLASEADEAKPAGPTNNRNFVFAAVTPPAKDAKAPKRKADNVNIGTPRLIKKLKTDDKQKFPKASLLDHLKAL